MTSILHKLEEFNSDLDDDELLSFFLDYINKHTYFKTRTISRDYLLYKYSIENDGSKYYVHQLTSVSHKIGYMIRPMIKSKIIKKFNNRVWKVINIDNINKFERKICLKDMKYWDLYNLAKENELKGYSSLNKKKLIQFIVEQTKLKVLL